MKTLKPLIHSQMIPFLILLLFLTLSASSERGSKRPYATPKFIFSKIEKSTLHTLSSVLQEYAYSYRYTQITDKRLLANPVKEIYSSVLEFSKKLRRNKRVSEGQLFYDWLQIPQSSAPFSLQAISKEKFKRPLIALRVEEKLKNKENLKLPSRVAQEVNFEPTHLAYLAEIYGYNQNRTHRSSWCSYLDPKDFPVIFRFCDQNIQNSIALLFFHEWLYNHYKNKEEWKSFLNKYFNLKSFLYHSKAMLSHLIPDMILLLNPIKREKIISSIPSKQALYIPSEALEVLHPKEIECFTDEHLGVFARKYAALLIIQAFLDESNESEDENLSLCRKNQPLKNKITAFLKFLSHFSYHTQKRWETICKQIS